MSGHARIIADELLASCVQLRHRDVRCAEIAEDEQALTAECALIGNDIVVLPLEEANGPLRNDAVLLAQRDEPAVEREDGVIVLALCLDIDGSVVVFESAAA